ncbi:mRNA interferase [Hyella patelloides LEGE 07179]|uniref:mRNA interferase n=1 Tax=Hyella patelloides LEGE 07179 TaxID=945734 RepID=A0A563VUK6_9CYAN|nr:type II toxin-antitoxin system PemK/MazF family toxin [Hyella patelloides]VEP15156.1 mRNA interferase [Hyella patelloides LEGE 07179]
MSYKQLEIRWVDLEPTRGAETQKKRPCVIIQSDVVNRGSRTVIVAPILPGHKNWLFAVNIIPTKDNGLDKERHINLKQLRVVDVSRIQNLQGVLEQHYLESIHKALKIVFGF